MATLARDLKRTANEYLRDSEESPYNKILQECNLEASEGKFHIKWQSSESLQLKIKEMLLDNGFEIEIFRFSQCNYSRAKNVRRTQHPHFIYIISWGNYSPVSFRYYVKL